MVGDFSVLVEFKRVKHHDDDTLCQSKEGECMLYPEDSYSSH